MSAEELAKELEKEPRQMNEHDRRRKRALIVFQIVAYGWLLAMFLIQLHMYMTRPW